MRPHDPKVPIDKSIQYSYIESQNDTAADTDFLQGNINSVNTEMQRSLNRSHRSVYNQQHNKRFQERNYGTVHSTGLDYLRMRNLRKGCPKIIKLVEYTERMHQMSQDQKQNNSYSRSTKKTTLQSNEFDMSIKKGRFKNNSTLASITSKFDNSLNISQHDKFLHSGRFPSHMIDPARSVPIPWNLQSAQHDHDDVKKWNLDSIDSNNRKNNQMQTISEGQVQFNMNQIHGISNPYKNVHYV